MIKDDTCQLLFLFRFYKYLTFPTLYVWFRVERLFREINNSISDGSLFVTINPKKLKSVLSRFTALTGLLVSYFVFF